MEDMKLNDICEMYDMFVSAAKAQTANGIESVNGEEMMQVVDMIKDLAEAKKDCLKACYYKTVIEAMENSSNRGFRERMKPMYDESYFPDDYTDDEVTRLWRMGYHERIEPPENERYGIAYRDYKMARKRYTETKSESDKEEMDRHIREHLSDTLATMMDIYHGADADLRKKIKADITKLAADMV